MPKTYWQTSRFVIDLSQPKVMGIVNITPDSFSDGGQFESNAKALKHAENLLKQGADILDIGGESSRPGAKALSVEDELSRVLPFVREAVKWQVPLSIDTYKPQVMHAALDLGADIINDIWAMRQAGAWEVMVQFPRKCP
jgi:dihydropteroate synthase